MLLDRRSGLLSRVRDIQVRDASATFYEVSRHSAWVCMAAPGAQLMNWFAVAHELHRD